MNPYVLIAVTFFLIGINFFVVFKLLDLQKKMIDILHFRVKTLEDRLP